MPDQFLTAEAEVTENAVQHRKEDEKLARWAAGYGQIRHQDLTQIRVYEMVRKLTAMTMRPATVYDRPGIMK